MAPLAMLWLVPALMGTATGAVTKSTLTGVASVTKVISMLQDMDAKAKEMKNKEQVAFAEFETWCSQEKTRLKGEITSGAEQISLLTAEIMKLESDISGLGTSIGELQVAVGNHEADKKAEIAQRAEDHKAFLSTEQDYSESVDAVDRAIDVMEKQSYDRKGASSALLQLSDKEQIPVKVKSLVTTFLSMMSGDGKDGQSPLAYAAPEANAYEFQSGSIVEILKKLKDEFRDKLGAAQKEEMNAAHATEMIVMDLTDSIENSNREIGEKTATKAAKSEKLALNKKQLAAATEVKAANENTLGEVTTECEEKSLSYAEKQRLRGEEIQAIEKAVEILSSPEVLEASEKHISLAQPSKQGKALVQIVEVGSESARSMGIRRKVREFLAAEGERLHSSQLGLLAQKLATDPFAKVKKLVDEMITRLQLEANADAKHEGFCDTEMGKSKITRTKLSETIDGLDAAIEDGKATIATLTSDTALLSKEVADLEQAMTDATQMRSKEKIANSATIKDAVAAQNALAAATAVLKDFYKKALTATAFLQVEADQVPEGTAPSSAAVFSGWGTKTSIKFGSEEWKALANPSYTGTVDKGHKEGMQQFGGEGYQGQQDEEEYGVLALLELIQSDFANLEANTKAEESASEKAYDEFMTLSKKSKATKDRKVEMNNADQASAEAKLSEDTFDLKATQDQLLAADRYHATLVPQCIDGGMTFDERTKARASEIESLKQALTILSSEDIATTAF